jgi:hypothetical protein
MPANHFGNGKKSAGDRVGEYEGFFYLLDNPFRKIVRKTFAEWKKALSQGGPSDGVFGAGGAK